MDAKRLLEIRQLYNRVIIVTSCHVDGDPLRTKEELELHETVPQLLAYIDTVKSDIETVALSAEMIDNRSFYHLKRLIRGLAERHLDEPES